MISRRAILILLFAVIFQLPGTAVAQTTFARTEAMIPMRDGVKLHVVILTPQTQAEPLPILMTRTPYGVNDWTSDVLNLEFKEFVADGYTFVFQDIRGKFQSEGQFVMVRPPRDKRDAHSIDESTDTYDTIDWLIKNVPHNNGRVGIMGGSYDGWLATMSLIDPHPALKAVSPQAPVGDFWYSWLAQDQRFLGQRGDVLSWQTAPLKESVIITGDIIAHLFASTTGSDSDWVVKLIDVYPADSSKMSGYQLMVANEIFRGRYLNSFELAEAIVPDRVNQYKIDLHGNDYAFLKGHRIMVQVQSSWFPLYDRNPQKFVSNIFLAQESDFQTATQRIYRSSKYPSRVSVSIHRLH